MWNIDWSMTAYENIWMHRYVSLKTLCVWVWLLSYACFHVWLSTLCEIWSSLIDYCEFQTSWPASLWGFFCLLISSIIVASELQKCTTASGFTWILWIHSQVLWGKCSLNELSTHPFIFYLLMKISEIYESSFVQITFYNIVMTAKSCWFFMLRIVDWQNSPISICNRLCFSAISP